MKRLFILSCLIVCITAIAHAQTYTQHLQQKAAGKGSVVVTQSEEIDKLVNTANVNPRQQETAHKPA
ncbi:MAG: SPOR domain-containing protein, partial [Prevotella sp.]|nr:SPOR domain-containing protein [Prevotella sp.]